MPTPGWYAWGENQPSPTLPYGILATGDLVDHYSTPTPMLLPAGATNVIASDPQLSSAPTGYCIAGGQLYVWGRGDYGTMGFRPTPADSTPYPTPVTVPGMTGVEQVAAGDKFTVVLRDDGSLWFSGVNNYGQFGNGGETETVVFSFVRTTHASVPPNIAYLAASGVELTALIDTSGNLYMAGNRTDRRIPNGSNEFLPTRIPTFVQCPLAAPLKQVSLGLHTCLGLKTDGTVTVWGDISQGKAGDGSIYADNSMNVPTPQVVPGLSDIVHVSATVDTMYALKSDGTLYVWGRNFRGEAGVGQHPTLAGRGPIVPTPTVYPMPGGVKVKQVTEPACTSQTSLVVGVDGHLYGCGENAATEVCRPSEAPDPPNSTLLFYVVGGYPDYDQLEYVHRAGVNSVFAWIAPPAVVAPKPQAFWF